MTNTDDFAPTPGLISVIMPCYNVAAYVGRAAQSVLSQTYPHWECIFIDDGSTDGTGEELERIAALDGRFKVVTLEKNMGLGAGRNTAIEHSRGEWIALLDADDQFKETRLDYLLREAKARSADFIADDLIRVRESGEIVPAQAFDFPITEPLILTVEAYLRWNAKPSFNLPLSGVHPMMRRSFLDRVGLRYDEAVRASEDFRFYFEALARGAVFVVMPEKHYLYTERLGSLTRSGGWTQGIRAKLVAGILEKYHDALSSEAKYWLNIRTRHIGRLAAYVEVRDRVRSGRIAAGISALMQRPEALLGAAGVLSRRIGRAWKGN